MAMCLAEASIKLSSGFDDMCLAIGFALHKFPEKRLGRDEYVSYFDDP
jgi:hypothetical protein